LRPVIGITGGFGASPEGDERFHLGSEYFDAVEAVGGVPVLLPPVRGEGFLRDQLERVDALLIPGGGDFSSSRYGQSPLPENNLVHPRREAYDFQCVEAALKAGLPILGICYGMQVINVVLGGTLVQDLPPPAPDGVVHKHAGARSMHSISVEPDTRLFSILNSPRVGVNSSHHQAIDRLGHGLCVSARSKDGIIEAIEGEGDGFLIGVQWHPESLIGRPEHLALFRALVDAATLAD
jgi:putative glutamine amidotransferase